MKDLHISIIIIAIALCGLTGNQQFVWSVGGFVAVAGIVFQWSPFFVIPLIVGVVFHVITP